MSKVVVTVYQGLRSEFQVQQFPTKKYFLCQNNDHLNFSVLKIDPAPNHLAPKWSYATVPNLPSKVKFEVKN